MYSDIIVVWMWYSTGIWVIWSTTVLLHFNSVDFPSRKLGLFQAGSDYHRPDVSGRIKPSLEPYCTRPDAEPSGSGQYRPDVSGRRFPSLEPFWSRPGAAFQRPVTSNTDNDQINWSDPAASVRWHRGQRPVSVWLSIHFQLPNICEWSLLQRILDIHRSYLELVLTSVHHT